MKVNKAFILGFDPANRLNSLCLFTSITSIVHWLLHEIFGRKESVHYVYIITSKSSNSIYFLFKMTSMSFAVIVNIYKRNDVNNLSFWNDQMGVKCNYFNTPRSKIFHSSKFYWYQKKSVYKIWNSPIEISEFYSLREIGMEFKGSNFILFSKSQCCTCIFSSYYQEISFYFILFPQIVLHKRLQTAIVLCFHWRRFLGREYLLYTPPSSSGFIGGPGTR